MGEIAQSSVWFRIGYIGFELSWKDKIAQTNTSMKVVDLSEGLDLIAQENTDGGQETRGVDPHIWLSPVLVKEMSKKILAELTELYPQQSMKYKTNYNRFIAEIDSVDTEIRNMLDSVRGRKIITFHPVLSYFARNYGIEQYSLESGGKEPTPQKIKELTDLAKQEKIGVIYIQSELDRQQAEVFAEEVNGSVVQIRPLDPDWGKNLLEMSKTFVTHF